MGRRTIQLANALEIERLVETNQVEQAVSTGDERKDRSVYQIVTWTADEQQGCSKRKYLERKAANRNV